MPWEKLDLVSQSIGNIHNSGRSSVHQNLHPVLYDVTESYTKIQLVYDLRGSNFCEAFILNNPIFRIGEIITFLIPSFFYIYISLTNAIMNFKIYFLGVSLNLSSHLNRNLGDP
jgi:hypothetical protein